MSALIEGRLPVFFFGNQHLLVILGDLVCSVCGENQKSHFPYDRKWVLTAQLVKHGNLESFWFLLLLFGSFWFLLISVGFYALLSDLLDVQIQLSHVMRTAEHWQRPDHFPWGEEFEVIS